MKLVSFAPPDIRIIDSENDVARIVKQHENVGDWTCLAAFELDEFGPVAVFENLQDPLVVAFQCYGEAYGLIQHDMIHEFLLFFCYLIESKLDEDGTVSATLVLPALIAADVKIRMRVPPNWALSQVILNGKPWTDFDQVEETGHLPAGMGGTHKIQGVFVKMSSEEKA